jgi:hypothetical protein
MGEIEFHIPDGPDRPLSEFPDEAFEYVYGPTEPRCRRSVLDLLCRVDDPHDWVYEDVRMCEANIQSSRWCRNCKLLESLRDEYK